LSVPIDWFNRFYNKQKLCRLPGCTSSPKYPYHFYCGYKHQQSFLKKIYFKIVDWDSIRSKIIVRDKFTCKLCRYKTDHTFSDFDVDHIRPRAVIYDEVFKQYNSLKNKKKNTQVYRQYYIRYLEIANNPKNLRTLCKPCHKLVTADFLASELGKSIVADSKSKGKKKKILWYWSVWNHADDEFGKNPWRRWDDRDIPFTPEEQARRDLHELWNNNYHYEYFALYLFWKYLDVTLGLNENQDKPKLITMQEYLNS
jgi:5-methylcytosine-specific restriction endonuclease McrA